MSPNPAPGAVLLRMTQAGICGSDLHTWRGDQVNVPLPPSGRAMGHEGTGVVHTLGEGVTTDSAGKPVEEGDRVVYAAVFPCYHCHQCLKGKHQLVHEPQLPGCRASGPTSFRPTPTTCTCRRAIPSSWCRTNWTTTCWARSTAPWAP